jgi:hypothetical protein
MKIQGCHRNRKVAAAKKEKFKLFHGFRLVIGRVDIAFL